MSAADILASDLSQKSQEVINAFEYWHRFIYQEEDPKIRETKIEFWNELFSEEVRKEAGGLIAQL